jgi:hypothetical protein
MSRFLSGAAAPLLQLFFPNGLAKHHRSFSAIPASAGIDYGQVQGITRMASNVIASVFGPK